MNLTPGKTDEYVLSTGKTFYAHGGTLSPTSNLGLAYGADGMVEEAPGDRIDEDDKKFTSAERHEIGSFMISLWLEWMHNT